MPEFSAEPLTFTAARDWLAQKVTLPTDLSAREISNQMPGAIRMQAFMSAKVASASILENFRSQVDLVAAGKIGYGEARKRMMEFVARQGVGIPLPGTADDKDITALGSTARLYLIIRQNVSMAQAIGRREVSEHPILLERFPNYEYIATMDERVRDNHAELNGLILPKTDPFWRTHYPPWEYNCRCTVVDSDDPVNGKASGFAESGQRKAGDPSNRGDDEAQTGVVQVGTRTLNLGPNASGFVFRSDPEDAFGEPDFERVKNPELRKQVQAEWAKKAAVMMPSIGAFGRDGIIKSVRIGKPEAPSGFSQRAIELIDETERDTAALKVETLNAIRPDGRPLFKATDNHARDVRIPAEFRGALEGVAMVHNHPAGSPPSIRDFELSCREGLGTLNIPTPQGVFRLTPFDKVFTRALYLDLYKKTQELDRAIRDATTDQVKAAILHEGWKEIAKTAGLGYSFIRK